jgi:hypothetical protein
MKQLFVLILIVGIAAVAVAGGQGEDADAVTRPTQAWVTSQSELEQAVGPDGPWIILFEEDLEVSSDVVISGEVYEEEGADAPRRKFALYAQDENRNITDRYTLTAPNVIVRHENVRIQGGAIDGDVYVEAEGFNLVGATIEGNLYFENESLQESFQMDEASTVTGEIAIGSM